MSFEEDFFEKYTFIVFLVSRCLPMNLTADDVASGVIRDRAHSGASLADVEPMAIDKSVSLKQTIFSVYFNPVWQLGVL